MNIARNGARRPYWSIREIYLAAFLKQRENLREADEDNRNGGNGRQAGALP